MNMKIEKAIVRVGTGNRFTIPERLFDALYENGSFKCLCYLVLNAYNHRVFWHNPVEFRRVSMPEFHEGDILEITYNPAEGQFFDLVRIG